MVGLISVMCQYHMRSDAAKYSSYRPPQVAWLFLTFINGKSTMP